jgi:hypothetical protein
MNNLSTGQPQLRGETDMQRFFIFSCTLLALSFGASRSVFAAEELELIETPRFDDVKARTLDWVAERKVTDREKLKQVAAVWVTPETVPSATEMFDKVIQTFRLIDPATDEFVSACRLGVAAADVPSPELLDNEELSPFYRTNVAQFYAVYLVRNRLYDESLAIFELVQIEQSVDPPTAIFHQAVAQSELLMKTEGLATLEKLTKKTEAVPERYATVAELMRFQLASIKDESLDEVAQRMKDVERRLSLARGGQKTQKKEEEIVVLLDSIIKKLEQSSGGGGGQGNGGNTNQPGGGAQDSVIKGTTAPGETDDKNLKKQAGWGALPDADVAKAKNLLKRDFPENYRRAIEAYFRKSAGRRPE